MPPGTFPSSPPGPPPGWGKPDPLLGVALIALTVLVSLAALLGLAVYGLLRLLVA